jgi:HEAT repeat protein
MKKGMYAHLHRAIPVIAVLMLLGLQRGYAQENTRMQSQATPDAAAVAEAWNILRAGARAQAISVLGLLPGNSSAEAMAKEALRDDKPDVRAAAATALGMMRARQAVPELREAEDDPDPSVALAAANSLLQLGDEEGYDVYYAVLTGKRKGHPSLIAEEKRTLHDPKKMAEVGFEEGIGFVPFAGIGWDALRTVLKNDNTPIRAAAAKKLAPDLDPKTASALLGAASDKNWIVRAAALEAIALRDDPALLPQVIRYFADPKEKVRLVAAACVIRLADIAARSTPPKK